MEKKVFITHQKVLCMSHKRIPKPKGSLWYLNGYKTKVRVIIEGDAKSFCEVLETAPTSKFNVGDQVRFNNRNLYPKQRR